MGLLGRYCRADRYAAVRPSVSHKLTAFGQAIASRPDVARRSAGMSVRLNGLFIPESHTG